MRCVDHLSAELPELWFAADAVYQDREAFDAAATARGYRRTTLISGRACQVGLLETETDLVVSVRGSDQGLDWVRNAMAWKRDIPEGGRMHAGFESHSRDLPAEAVAGVLAKLARQQFRVWLTCHSLGAGVGPRFARRLEMAGVYLSGVVPFAPPRTFDYQAARLYNMTGAAVPPGELFDLDRSFAPSLPNTIPPSLPLGLRTLRVALSGDPVARVPPGRWGFGDCGVSGLLRPDGTLEVSESAWQQERRESPMGALRAVFGLFRLSAWQVAHVQPAYSAAIGKFAENRAGAPLSRIAAGLTR